VEKEIISKRKKKGKSQERNEAGEGEDEKR
jgi:hypothetical protein